MDIIVLSEISKKQEYIFKSNKLKENVGASLIIKYISEELSKEYLDRFEGYFIFEGGGKSLYRFYDIKNAKGFIKKISKVVMEKYPGVELFMVLNEFNPEKDEIIDKINELYKNLAVKKSERKYATRQMSYGLHKVCRSTQTPASTYSIDNMPISREIEVKLKCANNNKDMFQDLFDYQFPLEFDELLDENKSFIAVVHIDGNQMGKKINTFNKYHKYDGSISMKDHNETYLNKLQKLSSDINTKYQEAFKEMLEELIDNKDKMSETLNFSEDLLPIRPLILAGDDVTFVTNAKIGIELAKIFLEKLNQKTLNFTEKEKIPLHASAGISIVKSHYPFSKAYQLAEQLCDNAKKQLLKDNIVEDASLLDWHVAYGELSGSLSQIRDSYYKVKDANDGLYNTLTMKPLYLENKVSWKNYSNFLNAYHNISNEKVPRGKIKELRDIIREGISSTKMFIELKNLKNTIKTLADVNGEYGFTSEDRTSMYFDAIEIMDLFIELGEGE